MRIITDNIEIKKIGVISSIENVLMMVDENTEWRLPANKGIPLFEWMGRNNILGIAGSYIWYDNRLSALMREYPARVYMGGGLKIPLDAAWNSNSILILVRDIK